MKAYSIDDQIREVQREINLRERVYPNLVERGRMKEAEAQLYTERIYSVLATLKRLKVQQAPGLFD